jgi:hypothetical protein
MNYQELLFHPSFESVFHSSFIVYLLPFIVAAFIVCRYEWDERASFRSSPQRDATENTGLAPPGVA